VLQPLVNKVVDYLPFWKDQLMNHSGHLALIKSTLSASMTHLAISLNLPPWVLKALENIMKGFLWSGIDFVLGRKCLVAWGYVQRPLALGDLGIVVTKLFVQALWQCWLWLLFTHPGTSWTVIACPEEQSMVAFFDTSMRVMLGNSHQLRLWTRWINGCLIAQLAPGLVVVVPK
jgi:hypothetical protein